MPLARLKPTEQSRERIYEAIPPLQALMRLLHESVASRIRHRALLDVLARGVFDFDTYKRAYAELIERDRDALCAKIMLGDQDFLSMFASWQEDDTARYGVARPPDPSPARKKRSPPKTPE